MTKNQLTADASLYVNLKELNWQPVTMKDISSKFAV